MAKVEAKVTFLSYQYKNILVCNSVMEINSQVMVHSWIQYSKNIAGRVFKIICILKVNLFIFFFLNTHTSGIRRP